MVQDLRQDRRQPSAAGGDGRDVAVGWASGVFFRLSYRVLLVRLPVLLLSLSLSLLFFEYYYYFVVVVVVVVDCFRSLWVV